MQYGVHFAGGRKSIRLRFRAHVGKEFLRRWCLRIDKITQSQGYMTLFITGTEADIDRAVRISEMLRGME